MADKPSKTPPASKPAGKSDQQAAEASTKDGLKVTRENSQSRQEVQQQKTSQGQPNRG